VRDLFTHDEIFQQRWPARADLQRVLVIRDFHALVGTQSLFSGVGAKLFQAVELGIGVAAIQSIGPGQCAFGCGRLFSTRQALTPRCDSCRSQDS
jgi:hypothetical protein